MAKVRVLIIEDDKDQAEEASLVLTSNGYTITGVAHNLQDAYGLFYAQAPDIVIVDIYLDGQPDGIEFVETMNKNADTRRPFIFLTNHSDMNTFTQAKATKPYSYLLKPFNPLELQYAIDLALEKFANENGYKVMSSKEGVTIDKDLFIKMNRSLIRISMLDVAYVEVAGKLSNIVTNEGSYLTQHALKYLLQLLDVRTFYRVHRNFIVNKNFIKKIDLSDQEIYLNNDKVIPLSKNFINKGLSQLEILK